MAFSGNNYLNQLKNECQLAVLLDKSIVSLGIANHWTQVDWTGLDFEQQQN